MIAEEHEEVMKINRSSAEDEDNVIEGEQFSLRLTEDAVVDEEVKMDSSNLLDTSDCMILPTQNYVDMNDSFNIKIKVRRKDN